MYFYSIPTENKIAFTLRPFKRPSLSLIEHDQKTVVDDLINNGCLWPFRPLLNDSVVFVLNKQNKGNSVLRESVLTCNNVKQLTLSQVRIGVRSQKNKGKSKGQIATALANVGSCGIKYAREVLAEIESLGQATSEANGDFRLYHFNDGSNFKLVNKI